MESSGIWSNFTDKPNGWILGANLRMSYNSFLTAVVFGIVRTVMSTHLCNPMIPSLISFDTVVLVMTFRQKAWSPYISICCTYTQMTVSCWPIIPREVCIWNYSGSFCSFACFWDLVWSFSTRIRWCFVGVFHLAFSWWVSQLGCWTKRIRLCKILDGQYVPHVCSY